MTRDCLDNGVAFLRKFSKAGAPTNLKIGIDTGRALVQIAGARPREGFLGIEIKPDKAELAKARIANMGISNAHALSIEAHDFLDKTDLKNEIDCVHVYFPTPLQKTLPLNEKPTEERLLNPEFLKKLAKILRLGGELRFMTDVSEYFEYLQASLIESRWWFSDWTAYECGQEDGYLVGTPCEVRFRTEDRKIYAAVLQKISSSEEPAAVERL